MKRSFEIPGRGDLHEVIKKGCVSYRYNDGDTTLLVTTSERLNADDCIVTKFTDAKITIIIETDDQKIEYEGVTI
jgi:hypothetical protein